MAQPVGLKTLNKIHADSSTCSLEETTLAQKMIQKINSIFDKEQSCLASLEIATPRIKRNVQGTCKNVQFILAWQDGNPWIRHLNVQTSDGKKYHKCSELTVDGAKAVLNKYNSKETQS